MWIEGHLGTLGPGVKKAPVLPAGSSVVCDLKWSEQRLTTQVASELDPQKSWCLGKRKEVGRTVLSSQELQAP